MKTKSILLSLVTGIMLTGPLALAATGNDQPRAKSRGKATKPATSSTTTAQGNIGTVRTRNKVVATTGVSRNVRTRNRVVATTGNRTFTGNRVVTRSYPSRTYRYRTYSSGYPYYSSYGYGYPYSGVGVTFGAPYYGYGYNNYPYGYSAYGYPYNYNYGYYSYNRAGYGNGSIVVTVQSRLARAGYYHGPIDGVMGPETSFAIRAYERNHGLRMDGAISGPLLRSLGMRY